MRHRVSQISSSHVNILDTRKGDMKEVICHCTELSSHGEVPRVCAPLVLRVYCTETDTKYTYKLCVPYFMS